MVMAKAIKMRIAFPSFLPSTPEKRELLAAVALNIKQTGAVAPQPQHYFESLGQKRRLISPKCQHQLDHWQRSARGVNIAGVDPTGLRSLRVGYLHPSALAPHKTKLGACGHHTDNQC
jgi:hypothetical protein